MIWKTRWTVSVMAAAAALCAAIPVVSCGAPPPEANSTLFGPNVFVFDPNMPAADVEKTANDVFSKMEKNQFGPERYALLFKPGTYRVNFNVGFYTHVAGLGRNPDDVHIDGGVNVNAKWDPDGNALNNFWRTLENFAVTPSSDVPYKTNKGVTRIAVSQAAPLRRLHVKGELQLFDWGPKGNVGYASGGFLADSVVDGKVVPASQQQWLSRNSKWSEWNNAVWNMVFVGCDNTPKGTFPNPPYTVVDRTPVIREKPYLYIDGSGEYRVFVPALQTDAKGVSWLDGPTPGESISLDRFYIAQPKDGDGRKHQRRAGRGQAHPVHARRLFARRHPSGHPGRYHPPRSRRAVADSDQGPADSLGGRRGRCENRRPDPRRGAGQVADAPGGRPRGQQGRPLGQPHFPL